MAVAEERSFNGAARRLAVSPPIVTRLINSLENRLGAILFTRTTRRLSLTDAGERFFTAAVPLLDDLQQAEGTAAGLHQTMRGELRVTAPVLFGERIIAPIVRDFLDLHPEITIRALYVDRVVHLLEEGIDIAVRLSELPDSALSAIRVGSVRRVIVAAPSYIERHGMPDAPEDLIDHKTINSTTMDHPVTWVFQRAGKNQIARISPRMTVNTVRSAIDAACAGWGMARTLSYQVGEHLADGKLVEVLADHDDRLTPIHLVHQEGFHAAAKTRAFLDFATGRLRSASNRFLAKPDQAL